MTLRSQLRRFAAALAVTSLLAGCTRAASPGHGNPTTVAHQLRFSDAEDIGGLNPMFFQQLATAYLGELTMAWLFRYDHANNPEPELATEVPTKRNGDIDAAGTRITIKLRHGVLWSDGKPFTADDVVFTTNAMNDPQNPVTSREGFELVTKIDEPDKYTVVYHLKRPFAAFLPIFFTTGAATPPVLPKHILGSLHDLSRAPYNALPVGIGPFKYEAWHRGTDVVMVRDPKYWRGRAKLDRVTFAIIPDVNTVLSQIQTGGLDLWLRVPGTYVDRLKNLRGYSTSIAPAYTYQHYDFNVSHPILADVALRRALRSAVNRPEIVSKVWRGYATVQESFIPPTYPLAPKNVPLVPFDLKAAAATLDADGWHRGPDGIRVKNGMRLALTLALGSGQAPLDELVELTRASWTQLGVALTVKRYLPSQLFDPIAGVLRKGNWDVVLFGWSINAVDNPTEIFGCGSFPPNAQNYGRWCDPALTPVLKAFENTYDPQLQARALDAFDRGLIDQAPSIVLYYNKQLIERNGDITGFHPNAVSVFDDMMNVDI